VFNLSKINDNALFYTNRELNYEIHNSMHFDDLQLNNSLLRAVKSEGYTSPTPIQEKAIPHVLAGRDVIGCAQTGTGKTAAFALPVLQNLGTKSHTRHIRALVLSPTRELAAQIGTNFKSYARHTPLKQTVIFGGVGQNPQVQAVKRGVDIVVATPGRLIDLMNQGIVKLDRVEIFVLDEADRMLDMGFIHDMKRVIKKLPKKRQTLFFSATMPTQRRNPHDPFDRQHCPRLRGRDHRRHDQLSRLDR